jgi:hypothetical protein
MADSRVLVVGATGQLGGVIARKLAAAGVQVRALARSRDKLQALAGAGVELSVTDLNNVAAINEACKGITQIVATANNNMGKGPTSPTKIDLPAYQNLCAAARNAGVKRLIFVSTRGADLDAPVDLFRIKWYIENAIKRSGVPHVIVPLRAFMDIWIDQLLAAASARRASDDLRRRHRRRPTTSPSTISPSCRQDRRARRTSSTRRSQSAARRTSRTGHRHAWSRRSSDRRASARTCRCSRSSSAAGRPAVQRGRGAADDARLLLDAAQRLSGLEGHG